MKGWIPLCCQHKVREVTLQLDFFLYRPAKRSSPRVKDLAHLRQTSVFISNKTHTNKVHPSGSSRSSSTNHPYNSKPSPLCLWREGQRPHCNRLLYRRGFAAYDKYNYRFSGTNLPTGKMPRRKKRIRDKYGFCMSRCDAKVIQVFDLPTLQAPHGILPIGCIFSESDNLTTSVSEPLLGIST